MTTPTVFTIPPQCGFVDALAQGLLDRSAGDLLALARMQIWLPNRRAVRALTDAFVRLSGAGLLLPRMTPLAMLDADETAGSFADELDASATLAPAIDPLKRRLLLARLIRQARGGTAIEVLRLADRLAATIDAVEYEEVDRAALMTTIPDDLAEHWEKTLKFFRLIVELWPPLLAAQGELDPALRQRALLAAMIDRWDAGQVPTGTIVAAGMTGAAPPVARLLARVARLPHGSIVLPGLDVQMPDAEWQAIRCHMTDDSDPGKNSEDHPQFAMKCLLQQLGVARGEVRDWPVCDFRTGPAARARATARAMSPAEFTSGWRVDPVAAGDFDGVRLLVAGDAAEEAQAIALALRRSLTVDGQTAALITPDRGLGRRVAAHLQRWDIDIDDSAGTPLRTTPPGALLLAIIEAAARGFTPVALLAVLKHPLVRRGELRLEWLDAVRTFDHKLRGVRPLPGLAGLAQRAPDDLVPWWAETAALLRPLETLFAGETADLAVVAAMLREAGTALCGDKLWRGADGRAAADLIERLELHGGHLDMVAPADLPPLLAALFGDTAVRAAYGKHPRLAIYGLLEARLQRADLMILGGLNEGVWPPLPTPDPWLAPKLRSLLKLPSLDRRIGLAAHDFVAAMGAPQVLLTRARQGDSAPAVASRLWLRLQAFAGDAIVEDRELLGQARVLDRSAEVRPAPRPRPAPPAILRPRRISVTGADRLKADPFAFYAGTMLRLKRLDPLDEDPGAADRGMAVHAILDAWITAGDLDRAALDILTEVELAKWHAHPLMSALWAPRVRRMMTWTADTFEAWQAEGWQPLRAEAAGELSLPNGITLNGRADRIDRHVDGSLAVIDYKTGLPPSHAQVAGGFALQLGLLGWLAEAGRLDAVAPAPVAALRYWKLGGGKEPGKVHDPLTYNGKMFACAADHLATVKAHFFALCDQRLLGNEPFTAKLHPEYAEKYADFDQLARVLEWRGRPGDEP